MGLNSTLHPIGESGGGGLNLILFQLVDWIFCGQRESVRQEEGREREEEGWEREARWGKVRAHISAIRCMAVLSTSSLQVLKQTLHSFRNHTVILTDLKMVHVLLQVLFHLLSKQ